MGQQARYNKGEYRAYRHNDEEKAAKNRWYETQIAKLRAQIKEADPEIRKQYNEEASNKKAARLRLQRMKDEEYYNQRRIRQEAAAKKKAEEEAAAKKKAEEEAAAKKKADERKKTSSVIKIIAGINGPKDPNKITSITKDGLVRTLYCNPGPCTPGSVKLHENISGLEMGVDINTLAKRIETNAAQRKRQDNTNENNAKTAEDIASLGNVSLDTLFEQSDADLDETNDISLTRALSIPKSQVEKNKEAYKDSVKNSHKNKEAETTYVKNADEIKQYCLYEGC